MTSGAILKLGLAVTKLLLVAHQREGDIGCRPQPPDAVAALIERTAVAMGAPFETGAEIRAAAEREIEKIVAKFQAERQAGGMKQINRQYKLYRPGAARKG